MEWLSQLTGGQIAQGGAVVVIVMSAVYYISHWQQVFTDRLEKQGVRDEVRIKELGELVDAERRKRRAAEDRARRPDRGRQGAAPRPAPHRPHREARAQAEEVEGRWR